jgi:undecaprenyl-diphosphatase
VIGSVDVAILRFLYAGNWPPPVLKAALLLSFLGSGWMMLGLIPGLFLRSYRAPVITVTVLLAATALVVALLKRMVGRVRPCQAHPWAHTLPIDVPTDGSFPSGHAAGSFAFAFFVLGVSRRAGVPLIFLATLIALSRVALGVHYPSDVLAGALLGATFGWTAARAYRSRRALEGRDLPS